MHTAKIDLTLEPTGRRIAFSKEMLEVALLGFVLHIVFEQGAGGEGIGVKVGRAGVHGQALPGRGLAAHSNIAHAAGDKSPSDGYFERTAEDAGTGSIDRDYAALLIPHHQNSIALAKAELELGRDDGLQKAAYFILQDHQREIDQAQAWLTQHPQKPR